MAGGWKDRFALTGTEKKVFVFLLVTFSAGLGIRLFREAFPERSAFDYRSSDSTFAALSSALELEPDSTDNQPNGPVNVNTASKQQLMALPGIGEVTAERIILYREEIGKFTALEQLQNVKGISRRKLEQLRPLIRIH